MAQVKAIAGDDQLNMEGGKDVEIVYSESGNIKARIIAPSMTRKAGEDPHTEFPDGLTVYNYDENMELDSKLTANYGIMRDAKDEIMVRDDVVLVNDEGEKLNSEELIWDKKAKRIHSDKFVKITTPDEIIVGTGFEADEDFSEYTIKKITGRFAVEADEVE